MPTWQRPGQPRDRVPEVFARLVHVPVGVFHDVGVGADLEPAEHDPRCLAHDRAGPLHLRVDRGHGGLDEHGVVDGGAQAHARLDEHAAGQPEHLGTVGLAGEVRQAAGVGAIHGLDHGLDALDLMSRPMAPPADPVVLPGGDRDAEILDEQSAKLALTAYGLTVPKSVAVTDRSTAGQAAAEVGFPVVLKTLGLAHKTGANGLALGLTTPAEVAAAAPHLADGPLLIEQMVAGSLVEVLVGVTRDPAHGFVLTLGAGGTMTEVLRDRASLLIPASRSEVKARLMGLKLAPLLQGFRGKPPVDLDALLDSIDAVQAYVLANAEQVEEVEINPLICTQQTAIAADALIRKAQ